jgi:hypothetical protein
MTYSFARISAVVGMKVEDYYPVGKRWWVRLHEKGGKQHEMPAHHELEQFLDEYLAAAGIRDAGNTPSSARPLAEPGDWRRTPWTRGRRHARKGPGDGRA